MAEQTKTNVSGHVILSELLTMLQAHLARIDTVTRLSVESKSDWDLGDMDRRRLAACIEPHLTRHRIVIDVEQAKDSLRDELFALIRRPRDV